MLRGGERKIYSDVQREQAQEGARMARADLPVRPVAAFNPADKPYVGARGPSVRDKVKPKGHEAFLKQLESSGTDIEVRKISSQEIIVGRVKCSDNYTITIKHEQADGTFKDRVIYKHDLSEFCALTPRPEKVTAETEQ